MNHRKTLQKIISAMGIATFLMACSMLSSRLLTQVPTQSIQPTVPRPAIPSGWKLSVDSTGQCQVATPPDWQLGSGFFLEAQKKDQGPFADRPGQFPPMGHDALWGDTPPPEGKQFQIRQSLVLDDLVCSVWRIKTESDFTDEEKSELEQVGRTLQEVK